MAKPPADGVVATFAYFGFRLRRPGSSRDGGAGFGKSQPRKKQSSSSSGASTGHDASSPRTSRPARSTCVEFNQCVGCTRQFFTKSFLGDDAAENAP